MSLQTFKMYAAELSLIMQSDSCFRKIHHDVLSIDQLPSYAIPGAYIINTDPSYLPGQHWIALFVSSGGVVNYFDSYGRPPPVDLRHILPSHYTWNTRKLQGIFDSDCGLYCLFFLYYRCRGYPINSIINNLIDRHSFYLLDWFVSKFNI